MLSREQIKTLTERLRPELDALGVKLGWKFTMQRGTYGETFTFKVEAAPLLADGTAISKAAVQFNLMAHYYNLEPSDLGKTFVSSGDTYRITGLNTRAPKLPVLATNLVNGRNYKFPAELVRLALRGCSSVEHGTARRTEEAILADLRAIEGGLDPENLHEDGLASPARVAIKRRNLLARQSALHLELGRVPLDSELV